MARPPYKPTAAARRKVSTAAGAGMSHEEIAIGLAITRKTLAKHFAAELTHGAYARRLEIFSAMHRAAKAGSVPAMRLYISLTPRAAATPAPSPGTTMPEGKKAQAQAAGIVAEHGTEWEDLLTAPTPELSQ